MRAAPPPSQYPKSPGAKILAIAIALLFTIQSCARYVDWDHHPPEEWREVDGEADYLKAHLRSGGVFVFENWDIDSAQVAGTGAHLGSNRDTLDSGTLAVATDSVVLFETNRIRILPRSGVNTVITGIMLAGAVACYTNPKACFGSCPSIYAERGDSLMLVAEAFSSSIAPVLEKNDIDDIGPVNCLDDTVTLAFRNEALETHVIRSADLLAVPVETGQSAFQGTDGRFWRTGAVEASISARSDISGPVDAFVRARDGIEYFTLTDSTDLAASETIRLRFGEPVTARDGIVIGARRTLVSTFLLYQTLAYMGRDAGKWFARMESNPAFFRGLDLTARLGRIEVRAPAPETLPAEWSPGARVLGTVGEFGPLASDTHLVPLHDLLEPTSELVIRLPRGNWRIDRVALARDIEPADVVIVPPSRVTRGNITSEATLAALLDTAQVVVNLPREAFEARYAAPPGDYAYFLSCRGYYIEWMRRAWEMEEDPALLRRMLFQPRQSFRDLAPVFKRMEPDMEDAFWGSRFAAQ
ncbi:MAG: hypothetical protein HKN20_11310 [Gemmatimonadetes bacterium]|nr:hypothetical protein [Gemmatimonadota bacterium]